jgi:hypothetical protein
MINLNDIPTSGGSSEAPTLMPDGTIARAHMIFTSDGDMQIPEFSQAHVFRKSQNTSAIWLPLELTVIGGQFDRRKVWHNLFVHGDAMDDDGVSKARKVGLQTMRDIVNSAYSLSRNDVTPETQAKRNIPSVDVLDGIEVCVVIGVEKGTNGYADKNKVKAFIGPDSSDFIPSGGMVGGPNPSGVIAPATAPMPQGVQNAMAAQAPQQAGGVTPAWAQK